MAFWKKGDDEVLLDASKVDIVAVAADSASVQLCITHPFPWTDSDKQLRSLQEKIHTYSALPWTGRWWLLTRRRKGCPGES